jgi:hypothetical protein
MGEYMGGGLVQELVGIIWVNRKTIGLVEGIWKGARLSERVA